MSDSQDVLPPACRGCSKAPDQARKMFAEMQEIKRLVEHCNSRLNNAFPDGDIEGHRRFHEALIEDYEARKRLYQAIKEKTISGLIWAAIMGLGIILWRELLFQIRILK